MNRPADNVIDIRRHPKFRDAMQRRLEAGTDRDRRLAAWVRSREIEIEEAKRG